MPPTSVGRSRRIAEPGLLAAVAAVIHLADYFLAMGMIGSIVCPLPHVLNVRRHGLRAGLLGALCTLSLLMIIGGPVEAGFHLFLFVAPGIAAGWALSSQRSLLRVSLVGTLCCALGAAGTYYVLETLMGIPDSMKELGEWAVWAANYSTWPFQWASGEPVHFQFVPGLGSVVARQSYATDLLRFPFGIFLSLGFVVFYTTWFVAAFGVARLGEPGRAPPLPLAPRLPPFLALVYLATFWTPTGADPWVSTCLANANFMLALATYLVGYLNLLAYARGRPAGALMAMVASLYMYYVSIWIGLLSSLRSEADDKAWRERLAQEMAAASGGAVGVPFPPSR